MSAAVNGSPRIRARLAEAKAAGRTLLIPYLTAGFPELSSTVNLIRAAEDAGADLIEIGLPFSDPLADGPVIQAASQRALTNGMTHRLALELVSEVRRHSETPLIFMGYYNPLIRFGLPEFFKAMSEVGVDGIILPDLPLEESEAVREAAVRHHISLVFLIAPTTPDERIEALDRASTDFSYCVSVTGVTGARATLDGGIREYLARVASRVTKPFVVGFGISEPEQVALVAPPAAGVVIGSALIRSIGAAGGSPEAEALAVRKFLGPFRSTRPAEEK